MSVTPEELLAGLERAVDEPELYYSAAEHEAAMRALEEINAALARRRAVMASAGEDRGRPGGWALVEERAELLAELVEELRRSRVPGRLRGMLQRLTGVEAALRKIHATVQTVEMSEAE